MINPPPITDYSVNFTLDMINNRDTLNLFSDASMRPFNRANNELSTCYGSVAVSNDTIFDEMLRMQTVNTVPAAEIRGIRCSLSLALKWRYQFRVINIFSDSQLALFGLRDYIYNWHYNTEDGRYYSGPRNKSEVVNQEIILECFYMLEDLRRTNIVNLFHQKGHIENGMESLKKALKTFKNSNGIVGSVDYATIRYISLYNNYIDNKTRSLIRRTDMFGDIQYSDAVIFNPTDNLFLN